MTRNLLLILLLALGLCAQAQLQPGLVPEEVRDMSALCTVHTFQDLYGSFEEMVPEGYVNIYSSVPTVLDNKFEVFKKDNLAVVEIRGTTANMDSWMVNMHSSLLPAQGSMAINGQDFHYTFAEDTAAGVHAGYTLAIATIANEVLEQLSDLDKQGVHDVIITGHSQGGALAHLLRTYLEHLPKRKLPKGMRFKTYAFAAPMVGNKAFAKEYEKKFCTKLSSYSIFETEDFVPNMPISLSGGEGFSMSGIMGMLFGNGGDMKTMATNSLMSMFSGSLHKLAGSFGGSVEKQLAEALGEVELPPYRKDMEYQPMETKVELEPFEYPLILNDPTILQNDSIMAVEERDDNGVFKNKELYRKAPNGYHHKPYNYYVGILKRWFPADYEALKVKVLPENL